MRGWRSSSWIPVDSSVFHEEKTYDIEAYRKNPSYNLNEDIYYGGSEFSCTLELERID